MSSSSSSSIPIVSSPPHSLTPLVLLDVRNAYETEIGRFQIKEGEQTLVPVYDPLTRNVRIIRLIILIFLFLFNSR